MNRRAAVQRLRLHLVDERLVRSHVRVSEAAKYAGVSPAFIRALTRCGRCRPLTATGPRSCRCATPKPALTIVLWHGIELIRLDELRASLDAAEPVVKRIRPRSAS